jgi:hypothetical protein
LSAPAHAPVLGRSPTLHPRASAREGWRSPCRPSRANLGGVGDRISSGPDSR